MPPVPVALQIYTVRDEAARDFNGTLRRIAELGYDGVELANTADLEAVELRALLDQAGLRLAGCHVPLERLENALEDALDYQAALGSTHVVCPFIPPDRRNSADDYRKVAASLNRAGAAARERGITFCYHHHSFEFQRFEGVSGMDILFGETQPTLVKAELDTYWIRHGGEDPAGYIREFVGRAPLIHVKDMAAGEERDFAEVGEGILDWPTILEACKEAGTEWLIVEQDRCARPPLESAAISLANLRQLLRGREGERVGG